MAKFRQGNIKLEDNQKIYLGSDQDSELYFDGTEVRISTTVSGITPSSDGHVATKGYTDTLTTTISGDILTYVSSNYIDTTEMSTISGDIISQLTTASGDILSYVSSNYIDNSEMTTISGDLAGALTSHKSSADHDGRYYTETEVTTISGDLITYIDDGLADVRASRGGTTFYFVDENSADVAGYEILGIAPGGNAEDTDEITITSASGAVLIGQYVTVSGSPNTTLIPGGEWTFDIYAKVSSTGGTTTITSKVYKRSEAGAETELFTSTTNDINATAVTLYTKTTTATGVTLDTSDRIVIKLYGETSSTPAITLTYYYEGTEHYSRVTSPVVTQLISDHGELSGLGDDDHTQYALVTGARNITGQQTFDNNVVIKGNLTVSGSEFITETETVLIEDNELVINYGETASGVTEGTAGLRVDRGLSEDYLLLFDETDDNFQIGVSGSMQAVATREDTPTANAFAYWNSALTRFDTSASYTTSTIVTESEFTTYSGDIVAQIPTDYITDAEMTTISGDIIDQIPTDYISDAEMTTISGDIIDQIPTDYISDAEMTVISGDIIAQIPTDYISDAEMTVISGDIIAQIPTDYISDAEMTVISGDIIAQIPTDYISDAEMTVISGDIIAQIPTDYISDAEMTVISGDIIAQIPTDYISDSEMTTISGDIVGQIPDVSDFVTDAEITVISGDIIAQIPTDYISDAEMTVISGDIIGQIPDVSDFITDAEVTVISGDIVAQIPTDYISDSEMTTISGDIVGQIPSLAGYLTTAQFTTSSGDIVDQIPTDYISDAEMTVISGDIVAQIGESGASAFTDLTDVPADYDGDANKYVKVKADESGLEFVTGGGGAFIQLSDVPNNYTDDAGKYVRVNGTEDGLEFATVSADLVNDTTPQLGGNLDLNSKNIWHTAILTSSGTYQGEVMTIALDDADAVFGSALYIAADFHYDRADADASTTMPCVALAIETASGTRLALRRGQICDTSWSWSAGLLYVSNTAGGLTQTAPTGTGDQVQVVGYALSANTIYFEPQLIVGEVV